MISLIITLWALARNAHSMNPMQHEALADADISDPAASLADSSVLLLLVSVAVFVSGIVLAIGCVDWCQKQSGFKDFDNEDAFAPDAIVATGQSSEFTMYPPIDSTPDTISSTPVYFEPLPDLATQRRQREQHQANTLQLRPKVSLVTRDRLDSEDDLEDVVQRDSVQEKVKLQNLLTNSRNQLPRSQLQYIKELGNGWFGKVLQGEGQRILPGHKKTKVVIQMLREDMDPHDQLAFLQESAPYREIDQQNVLKLLGQCVETTPYLSVLELCPFGDLKTYLRSHRVAQESFNEKGLLLKFACDMAAGLQALHQHNFVHRDFAIRNCMLASDLGVKVGDYGLSEDTFKEDYYTDSNGDNIPIRWLAPETLLCSQDGVMLRYINKDSNLWSFGIALWEILTFGSLPYSDLSNDHVLRLVIKEHSVKLPKPDVQVSHLDRIYQLMQLCFGEPAQRPSLRELRIMLLHLLSRKDDPDTSAFDQKWNMLLPRRPAQVTKVTAEVTAVPNGGLMAVTGTEPGPTPKAQVDKAATRPTNFESNFVELDASLLGQAGSLESELRDEFTPDLPGVHGHLGGGGASTTTPANEMSLEAEFSRVNLQAVETPANELSLEQELAGIGTEREEAEGEETPDAPVSTTEDKSQKGGGTQRLVHSQVEPESTKSLDLNLTVDDKLEDSSINVNPNFRDKGSDGPLAQSTPVKEKLPEMRGVAINVEEGKGTPVAGAGGPSVQVTSPPTETTNTTRNTAKEADSESDAYLTTTESSTAYQTALASQESVEQASTGRSMSSDSGDRSLLGQHKFAAMLQTVAMSVSYDGEDPISYSSSLGSASLEPLPDDEVFAAQQSSESLTAESGLNTMDSSVISERDGETPTPTPTAAPGSTQDSAVQEAPLLKDESVTQDTSIAPLLNNVSTTEVTNMADVVEEETK